MPSNSDDHESPPSGGEHRVLLCSDFAVPGKTNGEEAVVNDEQLLDLAFRGQVAAPRSPKKAEKQLWKELKQYIAINGTTDGFTGV